MEITQKLIRVIEIAKNNNLLVVEDVAQAFGSQDEVGEYLGTKSDIGAFSFFPSKTLGGIGDGGMVATNNKDYFDLIVKLKIMDRARIMNTLWLAIIRG